MGNVGFEIEVRNCCLKKDNKTKLVDGYKLGSIYIVILSISLYTFSSRMFELCNIL